MHNPSMNSAPCLAQTKNKKKKKKHTLDLQPVTMKKGGKWVMVKEAKLQLNFLFTFLVIPVQTWLCEDYQLY